MIRNAMMAAALMLAAPAMAQPPLAAGTYRVEGGSYAADIRPEGDTLVVVEPNKTSRYVRQPDGTYHFLNDVNGILYGLRVIDTATVESFKPGQPIPPTRLTRVGGAPPVQQVELPPSSALPGAPPPAPAVPPVSSQDSYGAIARAYQARAQSDPANVQAWTVCAAVAQKRSTANPAEADAFARQSATVLQLIAVDPSKSPCPDAIPQALWTGGESTAAAPSPPPTPEQVEAERLRALNAAADARAKADAERRAAERAAYDRQVAATEAAKAQYAREQAAYQDAKARADAAAADYARQIDAYRRNGGKATPQ